MGGGHSSVRTQTPIDTNNLWTTRPRLSTTPTTKSTARSKKGLKSQKIHLQKPFFVTHNQKQACSSTQTGKKLRKPERLRPKWGRLPAKRRDFVAKQSKKNENVRERVCDNGRGAPCGGGGGGGGGGRWAGWWWWGMAEGECGGAGGGGRRGRVAEAGQTECIGMSSVCVRDSRGLRWPRPAVSRWCRPMPADDRPGAGRSSARELGREQLTRSLSAPHRERPTRRTVSVVRPVPSLGRSAALPWSLVYWSVDGRPLVGG